MVKELDNVLINSLNVEDGENVVFLLGAGCSVNSGCMSASKLVLEFKKRLYCSGHGIRLDIDNLFDDVKFEEILNREFAINPSINQYSYFFEKCFPNPIDRNQFIKNQFHDKKPSFGYLCFANYLITKKVKYVLTTNFDLLVQRAVQKLDEQYDIVNVSENEKPVLTGDLKIVKLHGDYNYDKIKNTESEVSSIPDYLQEFLLRINTNKIVVFGYSGQDRSVMNFLEMYLIQNKNVQLIWCGIEEQCQNEKVMALLSFNEASSYMCVSGFDSVFEKYYRTFGPKNIQIDTIFDHNSFNAFELVCTNQPEKFKFNVFPQVGNAKIYKCDKPIELNENDVFFHMKVGGSIYIIDGQLSIKMIANKYGVNIYVCSLESEHLPLRLYCKIIKELVKWSSISNGVNVFRDNLYIDNDNQIKEGLRISIDLINHNVCLIANPNYFICEEEIDSYLKSQINYKKSSLFLRKNWGLLNELISSILPDKLIFGDGIIGVSFLNNGFLEKDINTLYECVKEPLMAGNNMQSVNQLKILDSVGPKLTLFSKDDIHVGIFCCEEDKNTLKSFLNDVENGDKGNGFGIIPRYKGFKSTFQKNIIFDYNALPTISIKSLLGKSKEELASFYMRGLIKMYSEKQIDIALIYVGENLKWLRVDGDFDFHNYIKLQSANRLKTQFLEEKTIKSKDNRSKILLNFAVGIYTKTIGMPWYPFNYSKDTLFLGICFGRDSKGITVGCSQMFDGAGRGMQLIISQVSDKKRKNQYLSKDEAFELGKKIRQTYYRSSKINELKRIVIHRCDPFKDEEIEGFKMAFEGIDSFALIQIVEDTFFNAYPHNNNVCCAFPTKRGTIIKTSSDTAYVWTDGSVVEGDIDNGRTYRNSKRGIGKPLKIKKYYGNISINDVVNDLMYLTKMDFNSSDVLYSKLPVTIKYSRIVCDIVKQGNFDDELISFEYVM